MTDTKLTNDNILLSSLVLDNIKPLERKDFIGIYKNVPGSLDSKGFIFMAYEIGDANNVIKTYKNNKYFYNYFIKKNSDKVILYIVFKYDDIVLLENIKRYGMTFEYDFNYIYKVICLWHNYLKKPQIKALLCKNFYIM